MSQETEWFEEYESPKLGTILPKWFWTAAIAVAFGGIFLALPGCATESPKSGPESKVCMVQILGQTDSGVPVAALTCVSPEEFAKSQQ